MYYFIHLMSTISFLIRSKIDGSDLYETIVNISLEASENKFE